MRKTKLRNPVVGEIVTMTRTTTDKFAVGIVLPARHLFKKQGGWCVYWFDINQYGGDFLADDEGWHRWDKYRD